MTPELLGQIMRAAKPSRIAECWPHLSHAMERFEINTPLRHSAFLAQIAHECGELRYFREINGEKQRYAPYFGRGAIQLTWLDNYRLCGQELGVDLVARPEMAETLPYAFLVSGWYWKKHLLNALADIGPPAFDRITQKINGGYFDKKTGQLVANGVAHRWRYYERARRVLGC